MNRAVDIAKAPGVLVEEVDFPLLMAMEEGAALAIITGIEGPSYRPLGAAMAIGRDGRATGNLSSGCIEQDVIRHAIAAVGKGAGRVLRYGRGSPFVDLVLPCGGGLEVTIVPTPDLSVLNAAAASLASRQEACLSVLPQGRILAGPAAEGLALRLRPELRLLVFGRGAEAEALVRLARSIGFAVEFFTPDGAPEGAAPLLRGRWPDRAPVDARTAILMFFHDHEWEAPLLAHALRSPALYIGAQGSLRVHEARRDELMAMGFAAGDLARLASPFGLIPSVRDARTLAVSVLAQVLDRARAA